MSSVRKTIIDFLDNEYPLTLYQVNLELHGIFWFHTYAQPRDKYTHIVLPVIHNYPLLIAFLSRPVESSYVSVSGIITGSIKPEEVWRKKGFYIYPAIGVKLLSRTLTFSMSGTGYISSFKPKTRASVPDYTANQLFLPSSTFKTYIIVRSDKCLPRTKIIRMGAKRYGVFKVQYKRIGYGKPQPYSNEAVNYPFNVKDCPAKSYYGIMRHYAGIIAISGIPERVIKVGNLVLASPRFIG